MRRIKQSVLTALLMGVLAGAAQAACQVAIGHLAFGPYDAFGCTDSCTSGTLTVHCSMSPAPTVRVRAAPSAVSGGFIPRRMRQAGGQETLAYNLYVDPAGTRVWGDGSGGTLTISENVQAGRPWKITIYARIPPGQDVTPGAYSDTVSVAVEF